MIHGFDKKKRILFFPASWANAVVDWISGVCSPRGTLKIKNTLLPKENGSVEIDVDIERVASLVLERLKTEVE